MEKNEIVARWLNMHQAMHMDYNTLHEAWVKFRDLKFDEDGYMLTIRHKKYSDKIRLLITDYSITEAFDELVKGIEWYNNLNK